MATFRLQMYNKNNICTEIGRLPARKDEFEGVRCFEIFEQGMLKT